MREIILDTETTGLNPFDGHRIIEIGCIELFNKKPTGKSYHAYINPQRDVPQASVNITGLTAEFLAPYPVFKEVVQDFLNFIADDVLVIHNAAFDMRFLNAELSWLSLPALSSSRVIDTLMMARRQFPGSPASLDALCKRFNIDLSKRDKHGALLDAELLSYVYIELTGGRQRQLGLGMEDKKEESIVQQKKAVKFPYRKYGLIEEELANHQVFIETLKNPLWKKFS